MRNTVLARAFEAAALPELERQLEHPFVRGLGDGTLPEARFRNWVVQDYHYLREYARVLAWAAARADRLASMRWYAAALHLTLDSEMELHRDYAARFGIPRDELESADVWSTTRAYTDFLVGTARKGTSVEILAALLPCAWGYHWIGSRLVERARARGAASDGPGGLDPRYAHWIEMYSSDEFGEVVDWLRGEFDRLSRAVDGEGRAGLRRIFERSLRYESEFWEMCWKGEQ